MKTTFFLKNIGTFLLIAGFLFVFSSCKDDDDDDVQPSETYTLNEVGESGVSGNAQFLRLSNGNTRVTVQVSGTSAGDSHPMHIHNNSVAVGGGIAITLTPVDGSNGMSVTEVSEMDNESTITYEQLVDFNGYINIHLSTTSMATIIAQGDIGQNAP